jgi:hypothetical protein
VLAVGLALGLAAPASGQSKIFQDFKNDGQINPCAYSPGQLKRGLQQLPPDIRQYAPGLADQLRRPCVRSVAPAPAPARQQGTTDPARPAAPSSPRRSRRKTRVPPPPAPRATARAIDAAAPAVSARSTGDIPSWLVLLLGGLGGFGLVGLLAVRYGVLDPAGLARRVRAGLG